MFAKIRASKIKEQGLGTKENIEYIKNELSNEEKFLESVIKAEKFYKKHKKKIVGIFMALVIASAGYVGYEMKVEHDLRVSNEAYQKLLQNPDDKEALQTLQSKNEKLYHLFLYQQAVKKKDKDALQKIAAGSDPILADLAKYHVAALDKDSAALDHYAIDSNAILRELAILDESYLMMNQKNIAKAREKLSKIEKSPATPYALLLGHYGAKVVR